ncbi:MAG: hypothetical protein U5J83_17335 [Bryobacterales bacterium]|nr:hypothetical protein [Bryobacterales bacterium]
MARPPRGKRLEEAMERFREAAHQADDADLVPRIREALRSGSGHLAKKAAEAAGMRMLRGLGEDLEFALTSYLRHPEEDHGCLAKEAIARLLIDEPDASDEVWLAAARHIQMEASFGPSIDTAAALRGMAAMGVAASRLSNKVHILIDLLLDRETATRAGAVRALGYLGTAEALSLVRFKTLQGDHAPEVMGECFRALLSAEDDREETLSFVAAFLFRGSEEVAEEAALALGESRDPRALPPLMGALDRTVVPSMRATLLRAVALLRREEAYERLAAWLEESTPKVRAEARAALAVFREERALAHLFS